MNESENKTDLWAMYIMGEIFRHEKKCGSVYEHFVEMKVKHEKYRYNMTK